MESYLINGGNSENISMLSLLMAEDEPSPPPPPRPLKQHSSSSSCSSSSPFLSPDIDYTFLLPSLPETFVFPKLEPVSYDSPPTPLPDLLSLESFPHAPPESQESILDEYFSHSKKAAGAAAAPRRRKFRHHAQPAAPRKPTVSQKAYGLWKLLPGDHRGRRATAEMLEEAHRYIRFLQAQVSALRSMPTAVSSGGGGGGTATGLGRLTRQQVLEVVLNSPVAQAMMAEKGWCLMAAEQVALLNKIQARKRLIHHFLSSFPL